MSAWMKKKGNYTTFLFSLSFKLNVELYDVEIVEAMALEMMCSLFSAVTTS